jgi:hypothetical protein
MKGDEHRIVFLTIAHDFGKRVENEIMIPAMKGPPLLGDMIACDHDRLTGARQFLVSDSRQKSHR